MFGTTPALVLDIGMSGAMVEHYGEVAPGYEAALTFRWQGQPVELVCEVARTSVVREPGGDGKSSVSHSGVAFVRGIGQSIPRLQEMIATAIGKILAAQKANAAGAGGPSAGRTVLARLGEARRVRTRGFVTYRLKGSTWWRVPSTTAVQPDDGFTVAGWEDEEEVAILCRTYEIADEEGRRLIRLVAEMSAMGGAEEG